MSAPAGTSLQQEGWTTDEMMSVAAARALVGVRTCFVGIGKPSTAANLARATASRNRCSEPTPGLPPHENTSRRAHPAPIIWS